MDANPENTASATTDEYPIKYIAGQQKNIAGYACKLAQLNLRHDTPEEDPIIVDIWYTEKYLFYTGAISTTSKSFLGRP